MKSRRRWSVLLASAASAALVAASLTVMVTRASAVSASASGELTQGSGVARTDWDPNEPGLTSNAVSQPDFGQLWSATLAGTTASTPNQVYAQPLVASFGGVSEVIVATEENVVEALNPADGTRLWSRNLGPVELPPASCANLAPHIGITSTPVIDPATGTIYVIAAVGQTTDATQTSMYVHALAFGTGKEISANWPLLISGNATNARAGATVPFNATTANQRVGLLLDGGAIYFGTASHCDHGPYVGFIGRVTTAGKPSLKLWAAESQTADDEAGIWQSGGALMSDGAGRIFAVTGNGVSPTAAKGTNPPGTLGESVVRLGVNADGSMVAKDFFSPADNNTLDQDDADLGAGGPVAMPDNFGSPDHVHLMVTAGKDGTVWLLDRDNLGGNAQGPDGTDDVVSSTSVPGVWGRPAIFDGGAAGHYVYLQPSYAPLQAITVSPNAQNEPALAVVGTGSQSFGFSSGSPIVTSDGTDASTALVWVAGCKDGSGADAQLVAYPAVPPVGKAWRPVASFPLGSIAKFIQPATDGNRVYVGTRDGRILAFGRPATGAITAPSTDFGQQAVGNPSTTRSVTLTANAPVTINSVGTVAPFALGSGAPKFPLTLASGDTVDVPVTFAATDAGTVTGVLTVQATATSDGVKRTYPFSLSGTGTQSGIAANPSTLDFGDVPVGQPSEPSVTIQNTGTDDTTLTGATISDPARQGFSLVGAPPSSYVLAPLSSVTLKVQFKPTKINTATAPAVGTLTVTTADGHSAVVALTGIGFQGAPHLKLSGPLITPNLLNFGDVAPGTSATTSIRIENNGTAAMTIPKAPSPSAPFSVPFSGEGSIVQPGDSLVVSLTVTPTSNEPAKNTYSITVNDGHGPHLLPIEVNTTAPIGEIRGVYGCMTLDLFKRANNTPIVNFSCGNSRAQEWSLGSKGTINIGSSWCLDTAKGATANGTPVILFACNNTTAQYWHADASGRLVNQRANKCLDVIGRSSQPNVQLDIEPCTGAPTQLWETGPQVHPYGQVSTGLAAPNQVCLTAPDIPGRSGTPVTVSGCTTAPGQLVSHIGGTLQLSGGCLTLSQASAKAAITVAQCTGVSAQAWIVGKHSQLYNPVSHLCIDVPGATANTGTRLWAAVCNNNASQVWRLPG